MDEAADGLERQIAEVDQPRTRPETTVESSVAEQQPASGTRESTTGTEESPAAAELARAENASAEETVQTGSGSGVANEILPGPPEDFPFSSGRALPVPVAPNRIYRIMGNTEAAAVLQSRRFSLGHQGADANKYFSLDSRYPALFRSSQLNQAFNVRRQAAAAERAGDAARAAELRSEARALLEGWHVAEGQAVIVEVELVPGALERILQRSTSESRYARYRDEDIFIFKRESGEDNIAVPSWQLERFNDLIQDVRLHGWRAPFGSAGLSPSRGANIVTPTDVMN
jgi:hypothetical protein